MFQTEEILIDNNYRGLKESKGIRIQTIIEQVEVARKKTLLSFF